MLKFLCALAFILVLSAPAASQTNQKVAPIPVIDMRSYETKEAIRQAVENTKQNAVVVLIIGGDDILYNKVLAKMKALWHQGYKRIGIIWAATGAKDAKPGIGVFADGTVYASIKDAKPITSDLSSLYFLVRDGYNDFVKSNP